MGCDIHECVEVFRAERWRPIKSQAVEAPAEGFEFKSRPCLNGDYEAMDRDSLYEPYQWRNYVLFAALADVRNRHYMVMPIRCWLSLSEKNGRAVSVQSTWFTLFHPTRQM